MPAVPPVRRVRFEVRPWSTARELLPTVDGVSLVDLVAGYERASGFDVPGAYAGLVLDDFDAADLTGYLTGRPETAYRDRQGVIALLGCDCGEVGCWPLEAQVLTKGDLVIWRHFTQPFRPTRDYGDFGPFLFHRTQYDDAVREAAATPHAR
ncbi:hypothetical protein [Actinoplanes utahensis]|uniref:hypothetical protein n=1 Tax=Actinoplanes utahensis TaxID=1869 RepID=UPI001F3513A9|nr:hypothetical protein [Actinoplanes utahensis]